MSRQLPPPLLCIDIPGIEVKPEPAGSGYQAHVEGDSRQWSRGDTVDEAVGSLIRRLALEHQGANSRRENEVENIEGTAAECAENLHALALEVERTPNRSDAERYAEMVCDEFTGLQVKGSCAYGYGLLVHLLEALLAEARERYSPTDDAGEEA